VKTNWNKLARQLLDKVSNPDAPKGVAAKGSVTMSDSTSHAVDIGRQQVGIVYAKALLGAAKADAGSILEELGAIVNDVLTTHPKFREVIESPRIPSDDKIGILDRTFGGKVSPTLLKFLKVVAEHERLDCLDAIFQETRKRYNEEQRVVQVIATTAHPVDSNTEKMIHDDLTQRLNAKIDMEMRVDPSIIGGLVVRVGDKVYDGSVSEKLNSLRKGAVENAVSKMRGATDSFASS
jgi:F-type H+-transporting ATPase subunit delta